MAFEKSRLLVMIAALMSALTSVALAQQVPSRDLPSQRNDNSYRRIQQQDRMQQAAERLNDLDIVFVYPRNLAFRSLLASASNAPNKDSMLLCDVVSKALQPDYLARIGITREQWAAVFHRMVSGYFKVPVEYVVVSECDILANPNADALLFAGAQAKRFVAELATANRLVDGRTLDPVIDFSRTSDTLETAANAIVKAEQQRVTAQREQAAREDARLRAVATEAARLQLMELEQKAKAGDHDAARRGEDAAKRLGDRTKELTFRVLAAESGPPALKFEVGRNLLEGVNGLPRDIVEGQKLLEAAAAANHVPSIMALADWVSRPKGYTDDNRRAYVLFERAATFGDETARQRLSQLKAAVSANEWERTEAKLMEVAPWAGLGLVLAVAAFVAYRRRSEIAAVIERIGHPLRKQSNGLPPGSGTPRWVAPAVAVAILAVALATYWHSKIGPIASSGPTDSRNSGVVGAFDYQQCVNSCMARVNQCMANTPGPQCETYSRGCTQNCTEAATCVRMREQLGTTFSTADQRRLNLLPSYCR